MQGWGSVDISTSFFGLPCNWSMSAKWQPSFSKQRDRICYLTWKFPIFWALKSDGWRILCSSETWINRLSNSEMSVGIREYFKCWSTNWAHSQTKTVEHAAIQKWNQFSKLLQIIWRLFFFILTVIYQVDAYNLHLSATSEIELVQQIENSSRSIRIGKMNSVDY